MEALFHVFMNLALCTGAQSCWNRKGPSPNCSHRVGSMELSNISSWYAEIFRVPFTGTKGPSPAPEKQPHTIIPLHQTLRLAQCSQTSTVFMVTAKPSLIHQIARWRSTICHSRGFASHLLMYDLDAAAEPWKPIPWSSLHTVLNLKAEWSLEVCGNWLCRNLVTSVHYAPQHPLTICN